MTLLKKINPEWFPSEKPDLQVDELFDFPGPFEGLVKSKMAILVDAEGHEQELPGQPFECPICFEGAIGIKAFVRHVESHRPAEPKVVEVEEKKEETIMVEEKAEELPQSEDEVRAKRLANLEKARAAKKAKAEGI